MDEVSLTGRGTLDPNYGKLAKVDPATILDMYLEGKTSTEIAAIYGVSHVAISLHMLKHSPDQWKHAQVIKAMRRKDEADEELDKATDQLTVARCKERLKSAQWDLERVLRRVYGRDTDEVDRSQSIKISINVSRPHGEIVDAEVIHENENRAGNNP